MRIESYKKSWPTKLWKKRDLVLALTKREISAKYKGSAVGLGWALLTPVAMLGVYTFVFAGIFKARWPGAESDPAEFAFNLFAGLIVFNVFSEVVNRSPEAINSNKNLVTKVIFPTETICLSYTLSAIAQAIASLAVLIIALIIWKQEVHIQWLYIIPTWIPLLLLSLSSSWILATVGTFIKDVNHIAAVSTNFILFLSAVFYPVEALPSKIQFIAKLNPLIPIITATRRVIINHEIPSIRYLFTGCTLGVVACTLAYRIFTKSSSKFPEFV